MEAGEYNGETNVCVCEGASGGKRGKGVKDNTYYYLIYKRKIWL